MFRVLLVEDDADVRAVVRTLFEAAGFRVVEAASAERALIEARAHQPDLIVVDLGLPDGDGQTVIRAIRAFSQVPIVVLSARTAEAEKIKALDGGADDYVTKPFSAGELIARVRASLRRNVRGAEASESIVIGDRYARPGTARGERTRRARFISRRSSTACSPAWRAIGAGSSRRIS